MYTKQDISKQKQAFWKAFGRYMKPLLSSNGEAIGWLNYKTGNKHIRFQMDADSRRAVITVILDHPGAVKHQADFGRFRSLVRDQFSSI